MILGSWIVENVSSNTKCYPLSCTYGIFQVSYQGSEQINCSYSVLISSELEEILTQNGPPKRINKITVKIIK